MTVYNFGFIESQNSYPESWLIISNLPDVSPEIGEKTRKKSKNKNKKTFVRIHSTKLMLLPA